MTSSELCCTLKVRCIQKAHTIMECCDCQYVSVSSSLFLIHAELLLTWKCSTMQQMCICYLAQEYQRIRIRLSSSGASKQWELHKHTLDRSRIFYAPTIYFEPSNGVHIYVCSGANTSSLHERLVDFYHRYIYCEESRDLYMQKLYRTATLYTIADDDIAAAITVKFVQTIYGDHIAYISLIASSQTIGWRSSRYSCVLLENVRRMLSEMSGESQQAHILTQSVGYQYTCSTRRKYSKSRTQIGSSGRQFWLRHCNHDDLAVIFGVQLALLDFNFVEDDSLFVHERVK